MSEQPKVVDTKPVVMEIEAGTYSWCACGKSANHPFCDGSHAGSGMAPVRFEVAETGKVALCACKITAGAPFCDGSHSSI
ncbi:MAG: CDGSH iron-sulfur domain-containing protein [Planctomycetota bacterium]|nr:CDGSH iron-sulfur domain-containing protein [Planctomycetota bacterium]